MKIDILDEGFWSPEVFRRYWVMTSMTERCFESPGKCWGASWAKGRGQTSPLRGCVPPHLFPCDQGVWGAPSRVPTSWLGGQVTQGGEGEAHLGWALGPICPRVCPLPLLEAPWALVGGSLAHLGAGPFPLLAHVGLRGWWPLPVDPRTPPVVPVHYR